jgi:SAM-dependent methyltransferase
MQAAVIQRQYDEIIASNYDFDPQRVIARSRELALGQLRRHLQAKQVPLRVLDIGVGTGRFLEQLREEATIEPFAIDLSQKMIDIAVARIPDLIAAVDSADNLDAHFQEVPFDLVCTHFITGFVPMREMATTIRARLSQGGYWSFVGGTKAGFAELQKLANSKLLKRVFKGRSLDIDDFVCNPANHAEVVETFGENGFTVCECQLFEPDLDFEDLDDFLEFAYEGGWLTPFIEGLGLHRAGRIVRALLNAWVFPVHDQHNIVIGLARKTEFADTLEA